MVLDATARKGERLRMDNNPTPIRDLGKIAIRCNDRMAMKSFYEDIVGLPVLKDLPDSGITFFEISKGHGGHTCVLALFDVQAVQREHFPKGASVEGGATSTLHHFALTVDYGKQDDLCAFLAARGIEYTVQEFPWIGWRGVFITDPGGNIVEFVAGGHPRS